MTKGRMINHWWTQKSVTGSGRGLMRGTIQTLVANYWEKECQT